MNNTSLKSFGTLYSQKVPLCVILNTQKSEEQQNLHPIKNFWLLAQGDFNYMLEIRDQFYDSIAESYSALLLNVTTIWNVNHKSFTWSPLKHWLKEEGHIEERQETYTRRNKFWHPYLIDTIEMRSLWMKMLKVLLDYWTEIELTKEV